VTTDPAAIARAGLLEIRRLAGDPTWIEARGSSMEPSIRPGSRLLVDLGRQPGRLGEIIVFRRRGELVAHRLVKRRWLDGREELVAKGDSEALADRPVTAEAILGVVRIVEPPAGQPSHSLLEGRRGALVAHISWWGDRTGRLGRRLARLAPRPIRDAAVAAALITSRIPVRVTVATMLRLDRSEPAGRR
jgi:signal peptidase I